MNKILLACIPLAPRAKPCALLFLFFIGFLLTTGVGIAQTNTWTGVTSTNWNTATNWSLAQVPTSAHAVVIPNSVATANDNPVITADAQCASLTLTGGAAALTLSINPSVSLQVTNAVAIGAGTGAGDHIILAVGSGSLTCASMSLAATGNANRNSRLTISTGSVTVTGSVTIGDVNDQITFTGAGLLTVGGDMTGGTFTASTGTVIYDGAAQDAGVYTYNNLTLRGSGNKTFATTPTVNGTLSLEATASAVVTGAGVITYGTNATLQYNKPAAYTATDEEWITPFIGAGGAIIANTGTISLNANKEIGNTTTAVPLTIQSGATLSTSASNFSLTLNGNFTNAGTFTAGSSAITISGTSGAQSIAGFTTTGQVSMTKTGGTATFGGAVSGSSLVINGTGGTLNLGTGHTHAFTDWTMTAGTLSASSSTLNIAGNGASTGGTFTAGTSTVNYNGTGAQAVTGVNYYNLTLSGSGAKTLVAGTSTIGNNFVLSGTASATAVTSLTIGGSITLGSGTSFTAGAFTHNLTGNWINNGSTFTGAGSTINLNGTAQSIGGTNSTTFNNLILSGSNTKTFNLSTTATGDIAISSGVVANLSNITTHTANTLTLAGAGQVAGTWGGTSSAATNINTTFFATATGILTVATKGPTIYYSRQTGPWNSNTTWSTVTYGNATNLGTFPVAGDVVNVGGGDFIITVNVNSACASLNYQEGTGNSSTVTINAATTLDVSGQIYIPTTSNFGEPNLMAVGAGTLNAGSMDFEITDLGSNSLTISTGTANITGNVTNGLIFLTTVTFTGAGTINVGGDFLGSVDCSFTPATGTVNYNGASAQSVGDLNYYNLTFSNAGLKTAAGAMNIDNTFTLGSGTSFEAGAYTHTLAGNWINNGVTFDNTNSTFTFDGAAQSIGGTTATAFYNLTLAGTGTKTFGFSTTISALLTINSGVVANLGSITTHTARALTTNGTGRAPGTYGSTSSAATNQDNTFFTAGTTGILTVAGRIYYTRQSGIWGNAVTWSTVTYGNATNSGTFPGANDIANIGGGDFTITVNANASCASLNYQAAANNSPTVQLANGISLAVSGAINIPGAGTFVSGDDNTLNVGGGILTAGSLAFSAGSSVFGGHELIISTGSATITGNVTQAFPDATITFTNNGTLTLGGAFLNSTNCAFAASTGTVVYNSSTVAQTIGDFTYYNLTLNNTSAISPQLTLFDDTQVTNTLTMTSGIVNLNGSTLTLGNSGAASTLTRTASTTTNWMYGGTFARYWPAATAITSNATNHYGLFPVGAASASSYRPVAINSTVNATGTGLVSVTHTDATGVTDLNPVYDDDPTAGVINIVRKHNAQFQVAVAGVTGGTYNITATMTGLPSGTASDIRLAVSNGPITVTNVGTHSANTGTAQNPTVGRTGVALASLAGDYRITTINITDTPLPIELTYFRARVVDNHVELLWETAAEINNALFTVERTHDFENFYNIGEIEGKGNSRTPSRYTMVDRFPRQGKSYYRLKQTDFDGAFTYSRPVMVDFEGTRSPILEVFPNPVKGTALHVMISGLNDTANIPVRIFNHQGQLVFEAELTTGKEGIFEAELDVQNRLSRGIYIVKAGRTLTLTRKLVIE